MTGYYLRDYSEIASAPASAPWWSMTFDLVVKLGLVIGLIYLTMWALRTYVLGPQARRRLKSHLNGRVEVLDTTVLAPNRTVYLVEVADRVLVLGATGTTLSTLSEIREPEAIDLLKKHVDGGVETDEPASSLPSFAAQLRSMTEQTPLGDKISALRSLAVGLRRPIAAESAE